MLLSCDCIFVNVHYMKMLGKIILLDQTAEGGVHNYTILLYYNCTYMNTIKIRSCFTEMTENISYFSIINE